MKWKATCISFNLEGFMGCGPPSPAPEQDLLLNLVLRRVTQV